MAAPIPLLLLEDNETDAYQLIEMLEDADDRHWQITHSKRLGDALKCLTQAQFEVALLDLSLPDSEGLDTLVSVRSAAPALPIVVLAGLDSEQIALQAMAQGAQDYLVKGRIAAEVLTRVPTLRTNPAPHRGGDCFCDRGSVFSVLSAIAL
jgi:DNA-binding response OmpR family regulator